MLTQLLRADLKQVLLEQILAKNRQATAASLRFPEVRATEQGVTKQYEKDLTAEQRRQFEAYKKELLDQIRSRKDLFDQQRLRDREEAAQSTGLSLGEYNPDFRDLLKQELERQIRENKERKDLDKRAAAAQDKERLRRLGEVNSKADAEAAEQQASTRKKLKELIKGDFDSAWNRRQQGRHVKTVDRDTLAEPRAVKQRAEAPVHVEGRLDAETRERLYGQPHAVNRRTGAEQDYWFVKQLTANERKIVAAEEANRQRVQAALRQRAHDELDGREKVIVADRLFDKC